MKKFLPLYILLLLISISCNKEGGEADAWGNFEASEILISSESNGRILSFNVEEGDVLKEGDIIAIVDTAMLYLKIKELEASEGAVKTNLRTINSQNEILKQQIANLDINISRIKKMLKDGAATQKQLDDLTGQKLVLQKQIVANNSRKISVNSELAVLGSKKVQINENLERCTIVSPSAGTILQKYAEKGEMSAMGKALIKIADLDIMKLKVYVSGGQLSEVNIGGICKVRIDKGDTEYHEFSGKIINVSDKAEFTPKIIQTKEERVTMVYAVTISVENDGKIKSGMPGEALFGSAN
jgi:HlyD family secretion protein